MEASDEKLHDLARAAGLSLGWRDVDGQEHAIADETLRTVLTALGHRCATGLQASRSLAAILRRERELPVLLVADVGGPISLPVACENAVATGADGLSFALVIMEGTAFAPPEPGYYDLEFNGEATRLAVSPLHCPMPPSSVRRPWGASVQIPALRGKRTSSFGNFGELAEAVQALAQGGADAVAINPVHALFPGCGTGFSPYSPSSRLYFNSAMGDPALVGLPPLPEEDGAPLIDWEQALPSRLTQLRTVFAGLSEADRAQIAAAQAGNAGLLRHATFDALDCHFRPKGAKGWREWPARFRDPASPAVARFAKENAEEIAFHLFLQWLADTGLAEVQARAKAAGMSIGLVGDLAVGVDPSGSDAWSLGDAMLRGLTIGAPPDPLGPLGQNWSIASFSPDGLRRTGYAPWIAMLRAALAHGGGARIDHAFGLARLWVIPDGLTSADGVYLEYPFDDLIRLATLEAHLAGAFIIAEDLGTAPYGFTQTIAERHMLGMQVLWFERAEDHGFIGAQDYTALAAAMTGTHDTPTLAGWWSGTDLDWAEKLGRLPPGMDRAEAEAIRDWDRGLLWSTISGHEPRPAPNESERAVTAAIAQIAHTPAALVVVPVEDLLGLAEQPNLPGTVTEHPNWRRRLDAPLGDLLENRAVQARLDVLTAPA